VIKSITNKTFIMDDNLAKHEQISASDRDKTSPVWDMSQERAFTENLLSQRFNYFLVFYSITVAGFINAKNPIFAQIIITIGGLIIFLLALVLKRSQRKLDLILEDLFKDNSHPAKIVDMQAGKGSARRIIGIWIPTICYLSLVIGAIVHLCYICCLCQCK